MDSVLNCGSGGWFHAHRRHRDIWPAGFGRCGTDQVSLLRKPRQRGDLKVGPYTGARNRQRASTLIFSKGYSDGNDKYSSNYSCRWRFVLSPAPGKVPAAGLADGAALSSRRLSLQRWLLLRSVSIGSRPRISCRCSSSCPAP